MGLLGEELDKEEDHDSWRTSSVVTRQPPDAGRSTPIRISARNTPAPATSRQGSAWIGACDRRDARAPWLAPHAIDVV